MQTERKRPAPDEGASRKHKTKFFNKPLHITKFQNYCQEKSHWSRHPEERRRDAALLALFGLGFERVENTSFSSFCRKGVY